MALLKAAGLGHRSAGGRRTPPGEVQSTRRPWQPRSSQKVWDAHTVRILPTGQTQLFVGLHLIHEVTTPQAFDELRQRGWKVRFPSRTFGTVDHIIPTRDIARPFKDDMAEAMMSALERNCRDFGIPLWDLSHGNQGIVHVIGPELGLTQPGMTIACGDSHTSTHGAFGAVAFGIGTSQVRDVLASQCLAMEPLQVRRIDVTGQLAPGVYAKDVILEIIRQLGVKGGVGFAYEYGGAVVDRMSMDERMTMCNMSIEGGARVGYVNPDDTTAAYLEGRPFAPQGEAFARARAWWKSMASDADAQYDDRVTIDGSALEPIVTWGVNPGQSIGIGGRMPSPADVAPGERQAVVDALDFMGFAAGSRDRSDADRRRLHRFVHQLAAVGFAGSGGDREGPPRRRRAFARWSCRARRASPRPPSPRASIRSSARPASSGAAPAARCAWA